MLGGEAYRSTCAIICRCSAARPPSPARAPRRARPFPRRSVRRRRGDVLLEILPPLRAGDRHDVVALVQQPGERDLRRRRALPRRDLAHHRRRPHVGVEVLALVARIAAAEVALRILLGALDPRRSEIRGRAELNGTRPMPSSRSSGMMRGSRLRSHSEYSLCSAEIGCTACARRMVCSPASDSPRKRTFPSRTSSAIAPTDLLDRHLGIDAVLIEQIDVVGAEPPQRSFRPPRGCAPAGCRARRCSPFSIWKPNLVAMTTLSRRAAPSSARPSSSSLVYGP